MDYFCILLAAPVPESPRVVAIKCCWDSCKTLRCYCCGRQPNNRPNNNRYSPHAMSPHCFAYTL